MALGKDFGLCSKKKYLRLWPGCYGHRFSCICGKPLWPADNSSWCLMTPITHLGEVKALTSCSGRSAPVGSCPHSQRWSGAGPCWPCTWKILDAGFLHSSLWPWPSGSRYVTLRSTQCLVGREGLGESKETVIRMESLNVNMESRASFIWTVFFYFFLVIRSLRN